MVFSPDVWLQSTLGIENTSLVFEARRSDRRRRKVRLFYSFRDGSVFRELFVISRGNLKKKTGEIGESDKSFQIHPAWLTDETNRISNVFFFKNATISGNVWLVEVNSPDMNTPDG